MVNEIDSKKPNNNVDNHFGMEGEITDCYRVKVSKLDVILSPQILAFPMLT